MFLGDRHLLGANGFHPKRRARFQDSQPKNRRRQKCTGHQNCAEEAGVGGYKKLLIAASHSGQAGPAMCDRSSERFPRHFQVWSGQTGTPNVLVNPGVVVLVGHATFHFTWKQS